jgi:glycosyltransferase involved in cell wall biosynthesis
LEQAVQSCLDQTYRNWELIIVDDASTDETPALIARLVAADSRIRSIRNEVNQKLPGALNTGFAQARGEYLTWTSDDNLYRPHALARMVEVLESRPEVDIVYTDYTDIDKEGNPVRSVKVPAPEELVNRNCIGPCFLYRRTVHVMLGGYAEDMYLAEDYEFWLRASVLFRFEPLHIDLYLYRHHDASLTAMQGERAYFVGCEALKRHLPYLRWMDGATRARGYLRVAVAEQARGNIPEMRKCLLSAIRSSPAVLGSPIALGLLMEGLLGRRTFLLLQRFYWALLRRNNV